MSEKRGDVAPVSGTSLWRSVMGRGLSRTLIAWFLILALVPLTVVSGLSYWQAKTSLRSSVVGSLEMSLDLEALFINNWFSYRFLDLEVQATSVENANFLTGLSEAFEASGKALEDFVGSYDWALVVDKYGADLKTFRRTYGYYDVFLIDSAGNVLFSVTGETDQGINLFSDATQDAAFATACRKSLDSGRPAFSDFEFYPPSSDTVAGFLTSPIFDIFGDKIGLVALEIPINLIDDLMQHRSGFGETEDTYLIGADNMMRSNSALETDPTLLVKPINTEQSAYWQSLRSSSGADQDVEHEGAFTYVGPRGATVLGIHREIEIGDVSWALIAEIEEDEAFATALRLQKLALSLGLITVVVVLILSISIARRIVSPLILLSESTHRVALGEYDHAITVRARNEIGELAASFRDMLFSLRDAKSKNELDDWLKTGQAELSVAMRGEQDVLTVGTNIISFLARYIDAQVGAFYVPGNGNCLSRVGSFACAPENGPAKEYGMGEGIVGQVALEKKPIFLTEVPEEYLNVNSGLGGATPSSILVIPVLDNGILKGVIELGAFRVIGDREQRFLDLVVDGIAVGITTAESRSRVNDLLEETQAQSEELQSREEELSERNGRLSSQTEDLRDSRARLQTKQEELKQTNEELEEQQERIEHQNAKLQDAQLSLTERARDLEQTSRYKTEFLANMSHELRTPLNSLLILAQVLEENSEENLTEKQIESIRTIHSGGNDLLTLINDILDLSKVEAGKIVLVLEDIYLQDLADRLMRQFTPMYTAQQIDFSIEIDETLPKRLRTDNQRLSQVLKNLLSNALKFTQKGSVKVRIFLPSGDGEALPLGLRAESTFGFAITDTGTGIPEDKLATIFEAFKQADGTTSRKYGGTGLGLSISRELARALGGDIQVTSREGEGSTFTLYLPMTPPDEKPLDIMKPSEDSPHTNELLASTRVEEAATFAPRDIALDAELKTPEDGPLEVLDDRADVEPGEKTLLIVEDDAAFAGVLIDLARKRGFKCLLADQGAQALEFADSYAPSAIILDIGLQGMDGWAVMTRLKENPNTRHIPVHFMSALEESQDALKMGAIGYLSKPVNVEEIEGALSRIERTIGKQVKDLLIVAKDDSIGQEVADTVSGGDVKCTLVSTGGEAQQLLQGNDFDCVVLQSQLDDMSAAHLLDELEGDTSGSDVPVVVYSGDEITPADEAAIAQLTEKMNVRTVRSPERLLDETALFLHRVEADLPEEQHQIMKMIHDKESILRGKKVLLADDDMRNIYALSAALEGKGMEIVVAKDGQEAVQQLDEHPDIDLVLMDIMMPVMDGYEAMAEIRKREQYASLPIVALTAKAMAGDRQKCIAAGASDYLPKPVDLDKLTSLLRVWLYR